MQELIILREPQCSPRFLEGTVLLIFLAFYVICYAMFLCFVCSSCVLCLMLPVSLDYPFLIAPSNFSNLYISQGKINVSYLIVL